MFDQSEVLKFRDELCIKGAVPCRNQRYSVLTLFHHILNRLLRVDELEFQLRIFCASAVISAFRTDTLASDWGPSKTATGIFQLSTFSLIGFLPACDAPERLKSDALLTAASSELY